MHHRPGVRVGKGPSLPPPQAANLGHEPAAMEVHAPVMDHPKKRRRRRKLDRPPVTSNLLSDQQLRGEVGILSADLFDHLFPQLFAWDSPQSENDLRYVAVTPCSSASSDALADESWIILPVRCQKPGGDTERGGLKQNLRLPAKSQTFQAIERMIGRDVTVPVTPKSGVGQKVLILDVEPIQLDKIFIIVDGDALKRHEEVQREFGGGFDLSRSYGRVNKGKGKEKATLNQNGAVDSKQEQVPIEEHRLRLAVREALASLMIVRQHDFFRLPLAAHPITHVPFPPAHLALCEPVNQGLVSSQTEVIVKKAFKSSQKGQRLSNQSRWEIPDMLLEESEETSNEQFYSALEDIPSGLTVQSEQDSSETDSGSSDGSCESESDDSVDNIISLRAPHFTPETTGIWSSTTTATPRARQSLNGMNSPGSVLSNFTATTAQQGMGNGRIFEARSLLTRISNELLYPRPSENEDDEARLYIDVKMLVKLNCFSGDWIRADPVFQKDVISHSWGVEEPENECCSGENSRVVKIYGIPDISRNVAPRYRKHNPIARRSSIVSATTNSRLTPLVWASPVLLHNFGCPSHLRLIPKAKNIQDGQPFSLPSVKAETRSHLDPPLATEVVLLKIASPLSQENLLQHGIFTALKRHFECKHRIVSTGDLIALNIDADFCRLMGPTDSTADPGNETEEVLSFAPKYQFSKAITPAVVWFKVGRVLTATENQDEVDDGGFWGQTAYVDPIKTRMPMGQNVQQKLPPLMESTWQYYLGVKPLPAYQLPKNIHYAMTVAPKQNVSPLQQRLRGLITAATSPLAVRLKIDPAIVLLYSSQRNIGKATLSTRTASDVGIHTFVIDARDLQSEGTAGDIQESSLNTRMARALSCGSQCTSILLRHVETLTGERMISAVRDIIKDVRVLIATTTQIEQVSEDIRSVCTHEIEMSAPGEAERESILYDIIQERGVRVAHDVDVAAIAIKTAALVAGNLVDIIERAIAARQERLENFIDASSASTSKVPQHLVRDIVVSGGEWARGVIKADFDLAIEAARKNFADAIGAPKIPNVQWDDVGGLENVKDAVMETIQLPLQRPELFAKGMKKRSGILLYGPPGTGKTLLAKAIATEFSLNFFSVKGPELLNMYIGESEANVRRVFQKARDARPCVVFFDELDSVAPKRGNQGDSGGVMDRIVSQLLAELDGMSNGEDGAGGVFVIGATNRPDLLDPALLRPGRFDKMLYLGVAETHQKRLAILEALTRKFTLAPELLLKRVAESLPFTYTGADLYALCSDAMLKAITQRASAVDAKIKALKSGPVSTAYFFDHLAIPQDIAVMVTEADFEAARRELVGSVSAAELEHYQRVRHAFEAPSKHPSSSSPNNSSPASNVQRHIPIRPKYNSRTNTAIKPKATMKGKGKGKGKAVQLDSDSDDNDDAYMTSSDFETPQRGAQLNGFCDPAVNDDEEVYG
ncbi:MAG: hypothetical protein LQ342_005771 [Letrouitia transgressa]|nr:MAG: hypothetical protein LQ342_005771 [Letrouitia transgressa]